MKRLGLIACLMLLSGPALAQQRYLAPHAVINVLTARENYTTFAGLQCLKWETGGVALKRVEPGLGSPDSYTLSSKIKGVIARDGLYDECVGFVRMASGAPGSSTWKKGPPAVFRSGVQNRITEGTLLATFDANDKYSGHCVIFNSFRADGGMYVWDQNVSGRSIKWRLIPSTGRGGYNDSKSYFVVQSK